MEKININLVYISKMDIEYEKFTVANQQVKKQDAQKSPCVRINKVSNNYFTIIMFDPDAPNGMGHENHGYIHWWVSNIKYKKGECVSAREFIPYAGPDPPSGTHRYIFYLYEHEKPLSPVSVSRKNFSFNLVKNLTLIEKKGFVVK